MVMDGVSQEMDGVSQESCLDSSNRPKRNAPEMHFSQTGANAEK